MKKGMPVYGELVMCKITKIHPNSAEAKLLEYDKPGMIHVSEVASRWVRDIREFLKENQYVVCRVVRVEGSSISLSVKRVKREDNTKKMNEFKRERKSENLLEQIAKPMKKTLDQAYDEVGYIMQEEFGSLTKAFDVALKNPDLLKKKGVPDKWAKAITEAVKKRFGGKKYFLRGELELQCYSPNGVEVIRKLLLAVRKRGFDVSYSSAPNYSISVSGNDIKKLRSTLEEEGEAIVKAVEKSGGRGSFTLKE